MSPSTCTTRTSLRAAFGRMAVRLGPAMEPAIVQKAAPGGADVLVVGQQHPAFGGVVTVGFGGAAAAANADLPVRVLPLSDTDAAELVAASRVGGLLMGEEAGGSGSAATARLTDLLVRFAALLEQVPELAGVVANPVIVGPDGSRHHRRLGADRPLPGAHRSRGPQPRPHARPVPRALTR